MPRLVVYMPAHNATRTIDRAVRTTLAALPPDSQIVICDDGSTDDTAGVLDRVNDPRVQLIRMETSAGSGVARQRILEATDSEYIANMDADDVSFPWRFRVALAALKGADLVFGTAIVFGQGPPRPGFPIPLQPHEMPIVLTVHNPLYHSSLLARREVVLGCGGYSDLRVAQDYELWLRALEHGARLRRLARPLVGYRASATQISQSVGYAARFASQPQLRDAYWRLVGRALGPLDPAGLSPDQARQELLQRTLIASAGFAIQARSYYRHRLPRLIDALPAPLFTPQP